MLHPELDLRAERGWTRWTWTQRPTGPQLVGLPQRLGERIVPASTAASSVVPAKTATSSIADPHTLFLSHNQRKLKCDLGDVSCSAKIGPNAADSWIHKRRRQPECPSDGPCKRCMRESRACILQYEGSVRAKAPVGTQPYPRARPPPTPSGSASSSSTAPTPAAPSAPTAAYKPSQPSLFHSSIPPLPPPILPAIPISSTRAYSAEVEADADGPEDDDILLSSKLHNPSDALKLLAFASAQRARNAKGGFTPPALSQTKAAAVSNDECWRTWGPVQDGILDQREAEGLFMLYDFSVYQP